MSHKMKIFTVNLLIKIVIIVYVLYIYYFEWIIKKEIWMIPQQPIIK